MITEEYAVFKALARQPPYLVVLGLLDPAFCSGLFLFVAFPHTVKPPEEEVVQAWRFARSMGRFAAPIA
jgi:hypothetical protein